MLPDGTYDVIVVDADEADEAEGQPAGIRLDVAILAGAHKGEVVSVHASGLAVDPVDALATPGTLTVRAGAPAVTLEDDA
jgi:hypothetical protein